MAKIQKDGNTKFFIRMWNNRDSHSLLWKIQNWKMQNDADTLEDSLVVAYRAKQSPSKSWFPYPLCVYFCY